MKEVSLITICVDMPEITKRCLELIRQYTPPIYEFIIVCDRPSDEMRQWLGEIAKDGTKTIINPQPVGTPTARNMGIKVAEGKYVGFVDNDISVTERWLEPLMEMLKTKPHYGWVASKMMRGSLEMKWSVVSATLFLREAIDKVGLFDERFSQGVGWEDNDYLLRFWRAGYFPHGVTKSVVYHPPEPVTLKMLYGERQREKFELNMNLFNEKWGIEAVDAFDFWTKVPCEE